MKNKLIALFMALTFCFLSSFCFCSVGYSDSVYAASSAEWLNVPYKHSSDMSEEQFEVYRLTIQQLFDRCNLVHSDYYTFFRFVGGTTYSIYIFPKDGREGTKYSNSVLFYTLQPSKYFQITTNNLSAVNSITWYDNSVSNYVPWLLCYNGLLHYYTVEQCSDYGNNSDFFNPPHEYDDYIFFSDLDYIAPFEPSSSKWWGLDLSINETSFYDWLVDTEKYKQLPSYIGLSKLSSFISFYTKFGSNYQGFLINIKDWFSYMNISSQTQDNINVLKSTIDNLYQEYLDSFWHEIEPSYNELPHHRRNIKTNTTDSDTTLITDDSNDTIDISILRDILRGVISINNSVSDGVISLINALDRLDFTVNLTNGGGSSVTDLSVLYEYDINDFNDDYETFEANVSDITAVPLSYVQTINNNSLMPENMLSDKQSLTVNIPVINGFTVNSDGTQYETNTDTYTLNSTDYPWLDTIVKKMKRFASIMLIIGYLIHLRFKIADIVRGE